MNSNVAEARDGCGMLDKPSEGAAVTEATPGCAVATQWIHFTTPFPPIAFERSITKNHPEVVLTAMERPQDMVLAGDDTSLLVGILKFLIADPATSSDGMKCHTKKISRHPMITGGMPNNIIRSKRITRKDIQACRNVSRLWNKAIWEIMSPGIPGIITTPELAQLKQRIGRLDLTSLNAIFVKNLNELWGNDTIQSGRKNLNSLQILLQYMRQTDEVFAENVSREYKKFLLVKSIEVLAARDSQAGDQSPSSWKEKCQPTKVVDLYWHSHMLCPRKYQNDCMNLVNDIIDHEPLYENPRLHKGSDFPSKLSLVMTIEQGFFPRKQSLPRTMLFGKDSKGIHEIGMAALRQLELETCCG